MSFAEYDRRQIQRRLIQRCLIPASAFICAALCGAPSPAAQDSKDQVFVDIPAQRLSTALTEFGRETATEIAFEPATVRQKQSAALKGEFDRTKAISLLLAGTGLAYRWTPEGTIVVETAIAPASAAQGTPADSSPAAGRRTPPPSKGSASGLDPITVEAQRQREAVKHEVTRFIASVTEPAHDESLATWQLPVCPLVAGLPHDMGEFVLRRISQTALNAHAPLAPEKCHPNFYVIVTPAPGELLRKWRARYPRTFNEDRGVGGIKRFLDSPLPIRIWYNVDDGCPGTLTYDIAVNSGGGHGFPFPTCSHTGKLGSRLTWANVRVLSSVILVADSERIKSLDMGQFADYVTMVGLAQIRLDKDPGPAPTILRVFGDAEESRLQGLSRWDIAFLKALYTTYPDNVVQISQMETRMLEYITR